MTDPNDAMPPELPAAEPVVLRPDPPAGRKFPCPSCGAKLTFDPSATSLTCPYCSYQQAIERDEDLAILENDFESYLDKEEAQGKVIAGRSSEVRCTGCGANVLLEDKVQTEDCPFCLTHLENQPEAAHTMIPPESLLPFRIELRQARDFFTEWLGSLWFAPTELKKVATLGQLSGIYVPYWTYDSMTNTRYTGQRGDNYTTTETYTERDANGNSVTKTRTVTRIRWSYASGHVRHFFDDVLVCASESLPKDLIRKVADWNLPKLDPFQAEYLSGFRTERYSIGLKQGFINAKEIMEPTIRQLIRQDIGGDHQRIDDMKVRYSAITFKPLLLPLWVAVYRYHDKTYQILVNGTTGKVAGYRPWSAWKIIRLVVLILIIIGIIVAIVMSAQK